MRRPAAGGGFTILEALVASVVLFAAIGGGLALLFEVDRAARSLGARGRVTDEARRIAALLRADLSRAEPTPFLEAPGDALPVPLPLDDDPATLDPVDERRTDDVGSPFNSVADVAASIRRMGEGDSLYFRSRVVEGDRSHAANVLWRAAFRDENRNGRADPGERRLERVVVPLGAGGLDASRMRVETLTSRLVHFRLSSFDARERRFVDPPARIRRFLYPPDGAAPGFLSRDGVFTCDAVTDGFAELRREDTVYLEPSGLPAGLYPIADIRAGRLLFRFPVPPGDGPTPFRAAYLPIAIRASFAIEADAVLRDQLLWPVPPEVTGRADRRAIVRTFAITVVMRGSV